MAQNDFILKITAFLDKVRSKKQIKSDIKTFNIKFPFTGTLDKPKTIKQIKNDIKALRDIFFVNLTGKLNKTKTKAQLKQDTASLTGTVSLTGKVNQKSTNASVQQATKQAQAVANKNKIKLDASFNIKKSKLLADIQYFAQQNSKMMKDANMASKYNTLLDNAKLATSNKEIRSLRMQLSAMRSELRANNLAGLTLGDTLKKTFKRAMELFSSTGFAMLLSQQIRQAWRESLNLDQAFTNLVKVQSALTRGDYPEYLEQCTRKAKELATTQQALIEGATEFSKSGYDLTTSNKLSTQSTVLSNVGDMTASDSAKALISGVQAYDTISGYDDVIDKAKVLIDLYNELGNTCAITTEEVAKSVQAVGSVFADSNTSVQELVSLVAAGNRQFQDADSTALALRTAALRIRGAKVELEQMGEETDVVYTSVSKLQEKIADLTNIDGKGGVQILEADQKTYRSIYEIFVDLSKVYQQMSDVDQSALLNLISGVHRSSAISAVLNNMAEAQEIYQRSLESTGSAQEEYDKYLESSIASLNTFKANMIETYQAVFNGETTKAILDTGSSVLEFLNSLGLIESTLKGFIAIGAVKALTTLSTAFKASALQASNFGKALQFANSIPNDPNSNLAKRFSSLKNIAIASKSLNEAQLKLVLSNKALSNEDRIRVLRLMGLEKSVAKVKLEEMGLAQATNAQSTAQKAATINTFSFSAAVKGLGNSLRLAFISNPAGIAIMTLSTIIGAVSAKVSEYKENIRETRQANMDAATSAKEEADSLNELYIQYSKLSSITDKTSQQEDDFKQVVQDITKALGNKADALEGVTAGTDEYAKSLREATKAELESQYATAKVGAKAAEEALKDKTYSGWDGSQITIAKNEQMTAIEEHVAALEAVQDILAKYEDMSSNGMEWEPVGWDEDRNNMNAVLEYYYDLIEARDRLATDENADFLMSSDIYKSINTTINSLSESVKNYTEQQYQALLLQYEWQNGIPRTEEEFKAMEESILSASGAGEEFQKVLKDFLINDFASFFPEEEIAKTEQSAKKLFNQLIVSKESLDKFQSSVQSAYDSYAKLMNPDISSSDILSSIQSITSAVSDMDGSLNWEFIDGQSNSLELLGNAIEDISRKYAESVLSGAGIDIDSKFGQMLANNIIQAQKASIELDNLNDGLDSLQSAYSSLTDIVEAYNETGYLTFDQLQTLLELEPQYLACLIDENGQLQLNEQAMVALANQRLNESEAQALQQAISELGTLALQDEKKAVEDNATAFTNAIDDLAGYNQELANTIAEATVGASAIRDLNAAISGAQSQGATDDQINTVLSNLETKLKLISDVRNKVQSGGLGAVANPTTSSSSKSEKDAWLEEYKKKLSMLEDQLDQQLINEKEFYDQSEALLNQYLKDTPAHIEKYAEEISDAEKKLHDNWNSAFDFEKGNLEDKLSDKLITDIEYYKELSKLNNEYYRPTGMLDNGNVISDEQIASVREYADVLAKLKDSADINAEPEFATAFEKISKVAKESGVSVENLIETYNKFLEGDDRYGNFTDEFEDNNRDIRDSLRDLYKDLFDNLNKSVDEMQSAFSTIGDAMKEYSENQALSIDTVQELLSLNPLYLSMLMDENGQLQLNEEAYQKLAKAKLEQMVNDMGLSVAEQILAIETTEQAKALMEAGDANLYMADTSRIAADQAVSDALDIARARSIMQNDSSIYDAAQMLLQSYENAKKLIPMVSFDTQSLRGGSADKEDKEEEKVRKDEKDWTERIVDRIDKGLEKASDAIKKISDKTDRLINSVDKFFSWQKKNSMINRAVKSSDKEIKENQKQIYKLIDAAKMVSEVVQVYSKKLESIELSDEYINKIKNGSLEIEEFITVEKSTSKSSSKSKSDVSELTEEDETLSDIIDKYEKWYNKIEDMNEKMEEYNNSIEDCRNSIAELYEKQRDLIRQKLDNVLDYYSDMDTYLSSITSKVESLISLNDQMGKRTSLTELVEQFAKLNTQIESATSESEGFEIVKKKIASGTAESVQKAVADDNVKEAERIQSEIENLVVTESGSYDKLLNNIAKTEAQIDKYIDKGWDVKKSKQFDKLIAKLQNYYDLQAELDTWATSNTIVNYQKVYTAYQKLQNKLDSGKDLSKSEWKKYTQYQDQIEALRAQGQSAIAELQNQLAKVNGTAETQSEADKIKGKIEDIQKNLENTAIYQNLVKNIENAQNKIAELDAIGYDNLTKKQKKTYDKLTATLEGYYAQKEALDEGATASNIAKYNKIYLAWKKLQDKLDAGKNLSIQDWQKYDSYTKQLERWVNDKATQYEELNSQLQDALNPPDKSATITKQYEEASKQMYDSYQNQIDTINNEVKNTQTYKDLLATVQKLEQKKDTKGLSKSEENKLNKYKAELEALDKGGTATNISEYMKVWEGWYALQKKLDNGKKLSAGEAKKYDSYKAKLEAWNNEKQTQINDLLAQMEDDLEALNKTYTENIAEAEDEINKYYENLYSLAKQIAEYNISKLDEQLNRIQSMVSYYKNLVGLYETFSGDKLSRLLVDLDEDTALSKLEIYQKELLSLNEQYDVNKNKMKEYQQLLDSLDTNDFESSMALFNQVLNDSSVSQATKDNLQQVIDLLNERALSADNWGEYADQWENEWQQALAETKQSLIEVAGSIQEVNDAIRETSLESLTDAITQLGYLKDTLSSITGLINDDWIFDEDGELTEYGNAKVSLLVEQMQTARNEADKYAQQMKAIMLMRDTYSSENAYQTALQEAKSNYLSSLNELKGFEDSVVSIMTQSNESIVNSLKDVISARIKALKAQKELYEYNKTITNSQKEIDNIKAQIDALENLTGATDAATKAKLAQLKADLEEKETALQETKDDHTYNLQITALEDFMSTLDQTMSDAADAVNKSFAAYKEAIDSALNVYEKNKDYLGEWSNTIMRNTLGLANTDGTNTVDVDVQQSESGESQSNLPTIKVENSDTVSAIESSNGTLHGDLIDIKTAIEQGIIVKVDSPLTALNPEMMNFVRNYVPAMTNAVVNTLPQIAERKATQNVINVHYDNLLNVEGNVDKDFAKVLPKHLEEAYQYTTKKLYRELNILK